MNGAKSRVMPFKIEKQGAMIKRICRVLEENTVCFLTNVLVGRGITGQGIGAEVTFCHRHSTDSKLWDRNAGISSILNAILDFIQNREPEPKKGGDGVGNKLCRSEVIDGMS